MDSTAYGASLAGGAFDLWSFIRRPHTVVRLLSWLFSVVVFSTIISEGYLNQASEGDTHCIFNQNDSACSYGVGVGILAFLACVSFLVLDAYLPQISNATDRKYIVLADLLVSGVWTFLWFVCFCVLANQWSHTQKTEGVPIEAAQAVVTFAFFSWASWAGLTYFASQRYREGVAGAGLEYTDPVHDSASPYPSATPQPGYQQSPFTQSSAGEGGYTPPSY